MTRRSVPSRWGLVLLSLLLSAGPGQGQAPRERQLFDNGWRFHAGDVAQGQSPSLADGAWRQVDLPHDWSIEGPYSEKNASGTGFLPGGIAWYRKTFQLPPSMRGRQVSLRFDGVYRNSTVWLNGKLLGTRPYGYSSFEYDLTPYLRPGAGSNVLAVRVDHEVVADSRWYPGSGIYRHVWLNVTGPLRIAPWGTYVTTPVADQAEALVSVETRIQNGLRAEARTTLVTSVLDERGAEVGTTRTEAAVAGGKDRAFAQQLVVTRPALWSPETPRLYTAVSRVYQDGKLVDEERTTFGIRSFYFSPERGLVLNGRPLKMKGVCIHHDLGALGAAFFEEALERRLRSFKAMGVNALRTSHNPMAPEFYELADRLGFLVMDEAFDEWTGGKRKWAEGRNRGAVARRGYNEFFEEWGVRDARAMVLRDRNHPSIIMWSIGNEIDYPDDPFVHPRGRHDPSIPVDPNARPAPSANEMPAIARRLIAAVKELDGTRPVTMALADINASNATGVADMLDVVGYNYLEQHYDRDHKAYPERVIYGSENSRGVEQWRVVAVNDFVGGQFLWTGMDYLGEAGRWPSHGSSAGLLDLEGFWKRAAYFRQALWSDQPMVYATAWRAAGAAGTPGAPAAPAAPAAPGAPAAPAAPGAPGPAGPRGAAGGTDSARLADWQRSVGRVPAVERWGWTGDARRTIPLEIYSNCDSVEVLLNGKSLGVRPVADRLMPALVWAVPNETGGVEIVGRKGGAAAARFALKTIGQPAGLQLVPDLKTLKSGGRQVATVEVHALDADGNRVPEAGQTVTLEVSGAGHLHAFGNGDLTDITPVTASQRKLYQGNAAAVVRSGAQPGQITVRATSPGLAPAEVSIAVEP